MPSTISSKFILLIIFSFIFIMLIILLFMCFQLKDQEKKSSKRRHLIYEQFTKDNIQSNIEEFPHTKDISI